MKIMTPTFGELDTDNATKLGDDYKWTFEHPAGRVVIIYIEPLNLALQFSENDNKVLPIIYKRKCKPAVPSSAP